MITFIDKDIGEGLRYISAEDSREIVIDTQNNKVFYDPRVTIVSVREKDKNSLKTLIQKDCEHQIVNIFNIENFFEGKSVEFIFAWRDEGQEFCDTLICVGICDELLIVLRTDILERDENDNKMGLRWYKNEFTEDFVKRERIKGKIEKAFREMIALSKRREEYSELDEEDEIEVDEYVKNVECQVDFKCPICKKNNEVYFDNEPCDTSIRAKCMCGVEFEVRLENIIVEAEVKMINNQDNK